MEKVRKKLSYGGVATILSMMMVANAQAVDWNGYTRIGPGQKSTAGDDRNCFDTQGADNTFGHGGVGRLGNECHTYGEFTLSQGGKVGDIDFRTSLMTNYFGGGSDIGGEKIGITQAWVQAKGFDIAPNQTFWMGKRYGDRAYVFYDDYFPINMTGTGAGIDGFNVGNAQLDVAYYRDGDQTTATATNPGSRLNVDLKGIEVNPGGKLRVTAVLTSFTGAGAQSGQGISLQHDQANVLGGTNTVWLQYAQGSAESNMGFAKATDTSDVKRWRFVESIQWTQGQWTGQAMLRLGAFGPSGNKTDFSSLGGHLNYAFTNNFKLQAELGTGRNKPQGGATEQLTKFTIAPTLTVGSGYYDRPELRFYVSRFKWNDAYGLANGNLSKSGKTSFGFQGEIWF